VKLPRRKSVKLRNRLDKRRGSEDEGLWNFQETLEMSNEEFEKKMEFIVEQQAHFASDIGELKDIVARLARATLDRFESTDERIDDIDDRISALVDSQMQTEENVKKTDEALRNLIAVVDRYFSEGRNGKPGE
jgi:ABC-type transporter Mla subunit MlaD